jgi:hypothetical protein
MSEKVGNFEVLTSNCLLVEIGKPIEISLGEADSLRFIFNIINDPGKETFSSEARLVNDKTIELDLFNFITSSISGGGTKYPVRVGHFQNKALYYSFYINSVGRGVQPLFTYTFYLGEEVANG